ncbi:hypothetical protein [Saccharothrix deserti]|uniref:hypothetical protein n=1 Tax=Saccharothrix deserti TaxID=2593674 RepID=UPI00131D44FC|nr:hypothetical protein [Saccharothrix deserti]
MRSVFPETERLALREFVESDVDSLAWLLGEPRVMRYIEDGKPVSRADVEWPDYIEGAEHGDVEYALDRDLSR